MIREPVIILGAPRSGTTMFYHTLARSSSLWSLGGESHVMLEGPFRPEGRGWESNVVLAEDLDDATARAIRAAFERRIEPGWIWRYREARRRGEHGGPFASARIRYFWERLTKGPRRREGVVMLEKTPKNCLRIPMLRRLFPDARFVHLRRDGRSTISSLMDGWREPGVYETYTVPEPLGIKGYDGKFWCFVLPPGWRGLLDKPLEEVCANQWLACVNAIRESLPSLRDDGRLYEIGYEDLAARPREVLPPLFEFLRIPFEESILPEGDRIRVVNATSPPEPDKWRKRNGAAIERILPLIAEAQRALGYGAT
jgi:hypothetical protein